jgi:dTDP-4-dehydrorhamnose 3,5-epimerase
LKITSFQIAGVLMIEPKRSGDSRGFFSELYNMQRMSEIGVTETFVQDNFSLSTRAGTVRGLHFQTPPHAQAKLVRVGRGRILDIAVDLRTSSPTRWQHVAVELSSENGVQLFIPSGFAHGFCTLESDTEVIYKVSDYYAPQADSGISWSDPELKISWPVETKDAIVSDKDARLPLLRNAIKAF